MVQLSYSLSPYLRLIQLSNSLTYTPSPLFMADLTFGTMNQLSPLFTVDPALPHPHPLFMVDPALTHPHPLFMVDPAPTHPYPYLQLNPALTHPHPLFMVDPALTHAYPLFTAESSSHTPSSPIYG